MASSDLNGEVKINNQQEFAHWSRLAANTERGGNAKQAADYWAKAAKFANNEENQYWAEARQLFCERRAILKIQSHTVTMHP